jgi:Tfp pilus assembly protein PilZ
MEYWSDLAPSGGAPAAPAAAPYQKRRHFRQKIQSLAYVNLDQANGGIIRNLSEAGIALQAVAPLRANQQVYLRFELLNPRARMEAAGRVAWANAMGQAGVEFLSIPQRARRQLKEWLFTQLLVTAHQGAWDSVFLHRKGTGEATELLFSAAPRPPIRLKSEAETSPEVGQGLRKDERDQPLVRDGQPEPLQLHGFPISISPRTLSRLVDGLILLSAVLLFSVVSLATTRAFPAWWVALGLAFGTLCLFAVAYWFLFIICIGATPGTHLAQLATDSDGLYPEEDDRPRFR